MRQPTFYADPTHRTKVVAKRFYKLTKIGKKKLPIFKSDCFRLKQYHGYFLKQNRMKSKEEFAKAAKAPLEHLFDNHEFCGKWCTRKGKEGQMNDADDDEKYYRCKVRDKIIYDKMKEAYDPFITEERLEESRHGFTTQANESFNISVAAYAPKNKTYSTTMSLSNRVHIAIGIKNYGHFIYWKRVFKKL